MKRRITTMIIALGLLLIVALASAGLRVKAKATPMAPQANALPANALPANALPANLMTDSLPSFGCETPSFADAANFTAGRNPECVTTGDFNRDGKLDLAVANNGSADVSILLGNGTGGFATATNISVVSSLLAVTTGDFNGDGKLDLAVTSSFNFGNLYLLTGDGNGSFTVSGPFDVGQAPQGITTGDFNGDGKLDLATANANDGTVSVLLGDGNGTFVNAANFAADFLPRSITTGDFNADGKLDLAVANTNTHNVSILLGKGNGSFEAATNLDVVNVPVSITAGDFNSDGKLDIATANSSSTNSHNVSVLLGNGSGGFAAPTNFGASNGTSSITTGDFNADGKLDLALSHASLDNVSILLGNATGGFGTETTFGTDDRPAFVTPGDFNGDGKLDLVTANERRNQSGNVTVLLNNCSAPACSTNFTPAASSPEDVGDRPFAVAVGDFNLDGKPDLATANLEADTVTILLGDGAGNFTPASTSPETVGDHPEGVAVGDFNHDGKPDLAVANHDSNNVTILLGDSTGNFSPAATSPEAVGANTGPRSVVVADFNLDGKTDLATANQSAANVTILLGDGTGNFTPTSTSPESVSVQPEGIATGDFNLDGKPDLATACFGSNTRVNHVSILLGDGTGNFTQPATSPEGATGNRPVSVAVGDFNLDGKPDLATANSDSNNVSIMFGDGTGNFTPATSATPVGARPFSLSIADFNLDGRADLAVANVDSNDVTILLGDGTGTFTALASSLHVGTLPISIVVGDFNRDGREDVATANSGSDNVTILLNSCNTTPTISAQSLSQTADTSSNNIFIATVSDPDQTQQTLAVTISSNGTTFSSSASVNGVSLSNLAVDSSGKVTANVAASCTASTASFTLKVTDAASANDTATLAVTVTPENQAPQITCANIAAQSTSTDGNCSATVPDVTALVRAQSTDNCTASASLTLTQNPPAGSTVSGTGSHPISVTVKDAANNSQTCTVGFTLNDTTAPTLSCANITKSTDPNQCAAVVSFAPTASDNCSGVGTPTCTPPSGTSFPKGTTSVTCTVKDAANNQSAPCSFTVTVNDTQLPSIIPPQNISVPATARLCSAVVTFNAPLVSDNCPGIGVPTCTPPSGTSFPKGTTTVTCIVKDAANNQANAAFTVTVVDTQPPTIACPPNVIAATINPGEASNAVSFETPSTVDNCGSVSVVCNPPSGSQFPRGVTTVNCTATDASTNQANCAFTVQVFDYVIVDDVNGKILRFVSTTGDYDFFDCRKNQSLSGRGTVTMIACKTTLNDVKPDRNLLAQANPCTKKGNATLTFAGVPHTLNDSNLTDNPVKCP